MPRHPDAKITSFAVSAPRFTEFPTDMLRYGECFPRTTEAAGAITANLIGVASDRLQKGERQRIDLSTHLDPFGYAFAQAAQRWRSFGWEVLMRDAAGVEESYLGVDGHVRLYHSAHTYAKAG